MPRTAFGVRRTRCSSRGAENGICRENACDDAIFEHRDCHSTLGNGGSCGDKPNHSAASLGRSRIDTIDAAVARVSGPVDVPCESHNGRHASTDDFHATECDADRSQRAAQFASESQFAGPLHCDHHGRR